MAEIGTEAEQRKQFITETEHRIAELEQQIEKGRGLLFLFFILRRWKFVLRHRM